MGQVSTLGSLPAQQVENLTRPEVLEQFLENLDAAFAPADRAALIRRASLLRGLGRLREAAETYRTLLTIATEDPLAKAGYAVFTGQHLPAGAVRPTPFVQVHDALPEELQERLWRMLLSQRSRLRPAGVYKTHAEQVVDDERRIALRLDQADTVGEWFLPWLDEFMVHAEILPRLGLPEFRKTKRELQVTVHGDGGFFSVHRDASPNPEARTSGRHVTFVYYFHRQPRQFTGGDLLLFDAPADGDLSFTRLRPDHNSIVFFESKRPHAVTRLCCASNDPFDGRWTVNGWLHRCDDTSVG